MNIRIYLKHGGLHTDEIDDHVTKTWKLGNPMSSWCD